MTGTDDTDLVGSVSRSLWGGWLVDFCAPGIEEGEDDQYEAASSLDKAKRCLRGMASDWGYVTGWRWERASSDLYRLYARSPEPEDG